MSTGYNTSDTEIDEDEDEEFSPKKVIANGIPRVIPVTPYKSTSESRGPSGLTEPTQLVDKIGNLMYNSNGAIATTVDLPPYFNSTGEQIPQINLWPRKGGRKGRKSRKGRKGRKSRKGRKGRKSQRRR